MVMGTTLADVAPALANPPPAPDAGTPELPAPDAGTNSPVTPSPDAGVSLKSSSVYMLPGGCSHISPGSVAVLGLFAGALLVLRRRRD